jgi:3-dehydroquinate synthase
MQHVGLTIHSKDQAYDILIGNGLLSRASRLLHMSQYSRVFVVTDKNVEKLWLPELKKGLSSLDGYIALPVGEEAKCIGNVQRIWTAMSHVKCDRKSLVIALGGGVTGDMGGFAASTYMRGIPFVQAPTSLLAQVDSSIGGKTGFDFDGLKNLVGTFTQPKAVLIDTTTLKTLPKRELVAGLAEMIKHALIKDAHYFTMLANTTFLDCPSDTLADLIAMSTRIKADVVQSDETESGERKVLNFGHTVGHAIEALSWHSKYPLLHGEAVAIGMVIEADLSKQEGHLTNDEVQLIKKTLEHAGLPTISPYFPIQQIWKKLQSDKKNEHGTIQFTLLEHIGKAIYNQVIDESVITQTITRHMEQAHAT